MATEQLEQRVAAIENTMAEVCRKITALTTRAGAGDWWELPNPMSQGEEEAFREMMEHVRRAREQECQGDDGDGQGAP